jgi:hypothetical protein
MEAGVWWRGRIRRPGAGRKPMTVTDPGLVDRLEAMIDAETRGDPESPLRWTCQSTRVIAATLTRRQHPVSHSKVAQILHELDYSLQGNRKTEEGEDHPHRDAQFRYINRAVKRYLAAGWPVISVDTKKKERSAITTTPASHGVTRNSRGKCRGTIFPGPRCRGRIPMAFTISGATRDL